MQLNLYVPRRKARVVEALDELARKRSRPKNEIVLEAIEDYLERVGSEPDETASPTLRSFKLGKMKMSSRAEMYEEAGRG